VGEEVCLADLAWTEDCQRATRRIGQQIGVVGRGFGPGKSPGILEHFRIFPWNWKFPNLWKSMEWLSWDAAPGHT
jgi:hypothetical protein